MKKLNKKKVKWIIREVDKREKGAWTIGQIQNITDRHVRRVYSKYKDGSEPVFKKCGRKLRPITNKGKKIISFNEKKARYLLYANVKII